MSASVPSTKPINDFDKASDETNGLTDEQVKELLAVAGRRKDDPAYVARLLEGVAEYRRTIQEELERELAEEETK